jgi:hypothetical protein
MRISKFLKHKLSLDSIVYYYKRNNWLLDISRLFRDYKDVVIDRPVFLLGTQGGGLTLVSRMLRRNKQVVSVSGNHTYWSGADEMEHVLGSILPWDLRGVERQKPYPPLIIHPSSWQCGINEYVSRFRNTEEDMTPETARAFRKILKWIISRHGLGRPVRFTDKSQAYTLKVSLLNAILKDCDPKFLLITRDPFALCYRIARGRTYKPEFFDVELSFSERLELACQHWVNCMKSALEDSKKVKNFHIVRFESVLENPGRMMKEICRFTELEFHDDMLPQAGDVLPRGSLRRNRWYPLRTDVNLQYYKMISNKDIDLIESSCKDFLKIFGYKKPEIPK